jgi:RNA polymerase sigma-70 factor (ECF subfamily)
MTHNQLPDSELIAAYQNYGDTKYLGELYARYSHLVYIICGGWLKNDEDCKDAVMEIFEKLIEALQKREISDFKAWLCIVVKNHCISKLRKKKYRAQFTQEVEDFEKMTGFVENTEFERLYNKEEQEKHRYDLQAALKKLNDAQRTCIELFYSESERKSYKVIARVTGFSEKQVKSHIQNGRRNLKILLTRG